MSKKDGSVEMKEFTNLNDDFGNFIANQDLEAYNQVINLTFDSKFKSMFGLWYYICDSYPFIIYSLKKSDFFCYIFEGITIQKWITYAVTEPRTIMEYCQ
jgi:hypothetical protein